MVGRHELTDTAWARIEPLLPATGGRGGRWRDHRQVINAILWQAKTGVPWRDPPERYGPWKTAHERLRKWTADGTWERILAEGGVKGDAVGAGGWTFSVDSSSVRAHQHAAGARKKGLQRTGRGPRRRRRGARAVPRWADLQAAPGRRWPRAADGDPAHRRTGRGQPAAAAAAR